MGVREVAHQRIDELSDEQLAILLRVLDRMEAAPTPDEAAAGAPSLRSLVGIGRSADATDVARYKDEYIAAALATGEQ